MRKAVIDIGSNSIKLRVVSKKGNKLHTILDITEVVRLGKGLENNLIAKDAMSHGVEVIQKMTKLARKIGAIPRMVGTMVLRSANNAHEFTHKVKERTGISIEILSGEEEARLAWFGATTAMGATVGNTIVFDTGGGSTEFIFGHGTKITKSFSAPIGAVHLTEKFKELSLIKDLIKEHVFNILNSFGLQEYKEASLIIGLGGGVVAMASVKLAQPVFSPEIINGTILTKSDIDDQVDLYASSTVAELIKIPGLPPKRADIILASACIVQCAMEILKAKAFRVCINGLRHGLLIEMCQQHTLY